MVGGETAGETAVVFFRAHRFYFLAGFLSEGVGPAGFIGDRARKSPCILGKAETCWGKNKS